MKDDSVDREVLNAPCARVACACKDVHHSIREREEWFDRVLAQVRRERHGVRLEMTEECGGVALSGWTDVPAFGVEDDEEVGGKVRSDALECRDTR